MKYFLVPPFVGILVYANCANGCNAGSYPFPTFIIISSLPRGRIYHFASILYIPHNLVHLQREEHGYVRLTTLGRRRWLRLSLILGPLFFGVWNNIEYRASFTRSCVAICLSPLGIHILRFGLRITINQNETCYIFGNGPGCRRRIDGNPPCMR